MRPCATTLFARRAGRAALILSLAAACGTSRPSRLPAAPAGAPPAAPEPTMSLKSEAAALKHELVARYGECQRARLERGIDQVAALWQPGDGSLSEFVRANYLADDAARSGTFARLEAALEQLDGHFNELSRELRRPTDTDVGPLLPIDPLMAGIDPSAHLVEDLFLAKVAFVALLNFPLTTLQERLDRGPSWSREEWAEARLASRFGRRVPSAVQQHAARVGAEADLYVAEYNLWMHHLLDERGRRLFPSGMRLISHWNLRDELKSDYDGPDGLAKQRMIVQVMERIVTQTIPASVIDNPHLDWNPYSNAVTPAPAGEVEADAPSRAATASADPEPERRYAHWLAQFRAARAADPFSPIAPTALARSFEIGREMPEARVVDLLTQVLTSPAVAKIAALVSQRLGRPLEPQDLWYSGFKPRALDEEKLDAITRKRYPNAQAFAADMPRILRDLGFSKEKAEFVAAHVKVDPARGAGHAMQSMRRGDDPRLRTRIGKEGMDYKGYNIAVHEFGHNVEQVFSLYEVDHTLLASVPNNAFTEAMAFVFQSRDLELLGLSRPNAEAERLRVLNTFWMTWEIAGVALVDIGAWHWMYDHPEATPAQLRDAVVALSREVWNRYYAPVLGGKDSAILGIYSHLVAYPLYLCDYPIGHLIAFQVEEHLAGSKAIGPEIERMTRFGAVAPDLWMKNATGAPVSADPLLRATARALSQLERVSPAPARSPAGR